MNSPAHYKSEQEFWDQMGQQDYCSLSVGDQQRIAGWIDWTGPGRVLDIGGGSGMLSRILVRQPGTDCVCMDISHAMLRHCPVPAVQADALRLPFQDASFDLVMAAAFFHHLPGLESDLLKECYRVLKPGGRLLGYDPNDRCIQNKIFMSQNALRLKVFSPDEKPVDPGELRTKSVATGFSRFDYFEFSFRNRKITAFEAIQRFILTPIAIGPLRPLLERWIFWQTWK